MGRLNLRRCRREWGRIVGYRYSPRSRRAANAREHQWSLNLDALGSFGVNVGALMAQGRRNREIAEEVVISEKTVNHHVSNIFSKPQVEDLAHAIVRARAAGLGLPSASKTQHDTAQRRSVVRATTARSRPLRF